MSPKQKENLNLEGRWASQECSFCSQLQQLELWHFILMLRWLCGSAQRCEVLVTGDAKSF